MQLLVDCDVLRHTSLTSLTSLDLAYELTSPVTVSGFMVGCLEHFGEIVSRPVLEKLMFQLSLLPSSVTPVGRLELAI